MKIALYDVDSKMPNLALMRLSTYHKSLGHSVEFYSPLWLANYDKIYASAIFSFSDKSFLIPDRMEIGGSAWSLTKNLPQEIEECEPDYTLYNYSHSIGFTMRGCRFNCKFCDVPKKEGKPKSVFTIPEIWTNKKSNFVMLLDNDFFGNPEWRDRIKEIKELGLRVSFAQGLNIRIITDEQAQALASVDFRNIKGKTKMVHFAWDRFYDEKLIDKGIERVLKAGIKPYQMTFYVLIGYNTTKEQDLYRVMKLRDYGINPFAMPYKKNDYYQSKFARWVNRKQIFKTISWRDYKYYHDF